MSGSLLAGLMLFLLLIGIFSGAYIGVFLLATGFLGLWLIIGDFGIAASMLGTAPFYVLFEYALAVIPLFILMGLFVEVSGASEDLYNTFNLWLGKLRGGLGIATVLSNAVFAAVTGVSLASAALFSKIALPQMLRHGYDKKFTLGTVAGSSVLGMLIPPSILFIVFGILAEESIGHLFIAGVIPGIVLSGIFSLGIIVMVHIRPRLAGTLLATELTFLQKARMSLKSWGVFALIILVLGGIYAGVFTPTEAGAVGAVGAFMLTGIRRKLTVANIRYALLETGLVTAAFFLMFIGAQVFARMLATSGFVSMVTEAAVNLPVAPLIVVSIILLIYIIMGAFLDSISIMIITLPIVLPVIRVLNLDVIWFGVVSVIAIETGLITPPFGMVVFVMKSAIGENVTIEEIFLGAMPFLAMMLIALVILVFFPILSTWLPGLM